MHKEPWFHELNGKEFISNLSYDGHDSGKNKSTYNNKINPKIEIL